MEDKEILEKLCYYDKRNPNCAYDDEEIEYYKKKQKGKCFCDNCFYGRTKLAEHILKLNGKMQDEKF